MARVFVTGSSTGLGLMTAESLIERDMRWSFMGATPPAAAEAARGLPGAAGIVTGDLSRSPRCRLLPNRPTRSAAPSRDPQRWLGYREAAASKPETACHTFRRQRARALRAHRPDSRSRSAWSISARACTAARAPRSTTCSGRSVRGAALKPMRKASFTMPRSPSRSRASGRMSLERPGTRVGRNPHGRARRVPTTRQRASHAGLARGQQRPSSPDQRRLLLSPEAARREPALRCDTALQDTLLARCKRLSGVALQR